MTDRRPEGTAYTGASGSPPPVPADLPDQQSQEGEDALDIPVPDRVARQEGHPELDEAGAGRSAPRNAGAHPEEHPAPDESTG
ncbi:hypothetical protein PV749_01040 [Streptomyces sp. ID03-2B]|uniref:Uncharacterized protein n=1 Tax=Streptomyces caviscabies TaxID=90079 RepID=A0ABW2MQ10_9ACTN|nr:MULTISPECIES: hypothetical protein [unclassified Streptomyces]MCL6289302.1 hypothetical protein [Streptomyces sp. 43Y-GA-1]MDX3505857.1 hypothetical protein [Streptomyces sp. ATCC51928]MDX3589722.1 hypothetical protein [Streptomyces sp. ID03-2B]MDX5522091.1 hypothetical protein [Streptomyces sp. DE06-01C]WKN19058.1 hypothetical protein NEH83_35680 [Streptomyces sp. JUS-F4]